jgi:hypothetical protein
MEDPVMNRHVKAFVIVSALAASALSSALVSPLASAQSNGPVTRAQVQADLRAIEAAGYNPALANEAAYPFDIQAAEARLAQQSSTLQTLPGDAGGAGARAHSSP